MPSAESQSVARAPQRSYPAARRQIVACEALSKVYPSREGDILAVDDLSFNVAEREIFAVVGPSGCGKSTTLRVIAGLERQTRGSVSFCGRQVEGPDPECAFLYQKPVLYPWMTITENVQFPLKLAARHPASRWYKTTAAEYRRRAAEILERVGLSDFASMRPGELSEGMKQRAAVAAALVLEPKLILLDEPFSALDVQTRLLMQQFLLRVHLFTNASIVLVTHQIEESLLLADRILMMSARPGRAKLLLDIPYPRPRDQYFFTPDFMDLRERMIRSFYEEVSFGQTQTESVREPSEK